MKYRRGINTWICLSLLLIAKLTSNSNGFVAISTRWRRDGSERFRSSVFPRSMTSEAEVQAIRNIDSWEELKLSLADSLVLSNSTLAATALRRAAQLMQYDNPFQTETLSQIITSLGPDILSGNMTVASLTDTFVALRYISQHGNTSRFRPLAEKTWLNLEAYGDAIRYESPQRLVEVLVARQYMGVEQSPGALYCTICSRLSMGDAMSKLKPLHMIVVLRLIAKAYKTRNSESTLIRILVRRLRKRQILETAPPGIILQAIGCSMDLLRNENIKSHLRSELRTHCYTSLRYICEEHGASISSSQLAEIAVVLSALSLPPEDGIVRQICRLATPAIECASSTLELRKLSTVFGPNGVIWGDIHRRIGERLLVLVEEESFQANPEDVSEMYRPVALLHRKNEYVLTPFKLVAKKLFLDNAFLSGSTIRELANFLWLQNVLALDDQHMLESLGTAILESPNIEYCNPKLACRILSCYANIAGSSFSLNNAVIASLFEELGEFLLSNQMATSDIASAICAYAKASYTVDMGIFDHLVGLLVSNEMVATDRQIAQCLWACGALYKLELSAIDEEEPEHLFQTPYQQSARSLASSLANRRSTLAKEDVTQALWALANLQINDEDVLDHLSERAGDMANMMTEQELANILWSLSKSGSQDFKTVHKLVLRISSDNSLSFSPLESSSILYALASMNIRDDAVFDSLSQSILEKIEHASAQTIANALWAHRTVHKSPPRQLLDSWTTSKLGIVAVQSAVAQTDLSIDFE